MTITITTQITAAFAIVASDMISSFFSDITIKCLQRNLNHLYILSYFCSTNKFCYLSICYHIFYVKVVET